MYRCIIEPATGRLREELVFGRSRLRENRVQALLKLVVGGNGSVTCLCRGDDSPPTLGTYQGAYIALRRPSNTGSSHTPGCEHYDWKKPPFGMPPGLASDHNGVLQINWSKLLADDEPTFGSNGGGSRSSPRSCPPLFALLWLLLVRAGLNVHHVRDARRDPVVEVRFASESMRIASSAAKSQPLSQRLLQPAWAQERNAQASDNKIMLEASAKSGEKLLFVAGLHNRNYVRSSPYGDFRALGADFGISLNIDEHVLAGAFKTYTTARRHLKAGGLVLALGIAEPRQAGGSAWASRIALLSVDATSAAPIPTDEHKKLFHRAMQDEFLYSVTPSDDPLVAPAGAQGHGSSSNLRGTPAPS